jgi:hypothetical protein
MRIGAIQTKIVCMSNVQYKFLVDGEWKCAQEQHLTRDNVGNENNWICVEEEAIPDIGPAPEPGFTKPESPRDSYVSVFPDADDYMKEP